MTDLTLLGIADAGRLMARGELTSSDLTEAFLKRIEAVDHKIASYITVTADLARNAARQADMEMKGGLRRGPMHGIPVALKDNIQTTNMPTTGGALAFAGLTPPYEATLTKNLTDAGAIIIAKTGLTELANWEIGRAHV